MPYLSKISHTVNDLATRFLSHIGRASGINNMNCHIGHATSPRRIIHNLSPEKNTGDIIWEYTMDLSKQEENALLSGKNNLITARVHEKMAGILSEYATHLESNSSNSTINDSVTNIDKKEENQAVPDNKDNPITDFEKLQLVDSLRNEAADLNKKADFDKKEARKDPITRGLDKLNKTVKNLFS